MIFLILTSATLFASKYSDFIDALYYEKIGSYATSYSIVERINLSERDLYLYKYLYDLALKGFRLGQISIEKLSENIERIVELEPDVANNWLLYAAVKSQQGDVEKAKEGYKKAVKIDPKNIEAYYQLALLTTSNTQESLSYFNKILEIDPSLAGDVYYNIAVLYSLKKETKKVMEYIEKAIKADPKSLKPYYFMALYWEENGDFKKVVDAYKKIVELEPQNTEALNRLGELYISTGDINTAEHYFKKTLQANPYDRKALWLLSLIEEERKNYHQAAEYLSKISGWENSVEHTLKMSYYQLMIGSATKAVQILEDASKRWPENPEIAYYMGLARMDEGRYEEAKRYFEIALTTYSQSYELRYNLGVICEKLNDVDCFKKHFGFILLKKPDDANVLNYLGYSLIDRDLVDEKVVIETNTLPTPFEMVEKAVLLDPTNYAYLDSLAWGYYKKGNYQLAYDYIEKAIFWMEKEGNIDPLIFEHKADILSMLGKYDDAYKFYLKAFLLDTSSRRGIIKDSLKRIFDKVSVVELYEGIVNSSTMSYILSGSMRLSFEYRRFITKKRFNYTFSSVVINDKEVEIKLYGPLMLEVFFSKVSDGKADISSLSEHASLYEKQIKDIVLILGSYFKIAKFFSERRPIRYQDRSFIFDDVFKKGDKVVFRFSDNILPSQIIYSDEEISYELKVLDFGYERKYLLWYPKRFYIKGKGFEINFDLDSFEIKR